MRSYQLDDFDRRLLDILQPDADLTSEDLAARVNLSPSAVQRRLKRLKASGVIRSTVAVIDPGKAGNPCFFIAGLEVESERSGLLARLRAWFAAEDAVQQVFYATGEEDFLLVVTAADVSAYDRLMARLLAENPNVRRFTTRVALAVPKRGLFVSVPNGDGTAEH